MTIFLACALTVAIETPFLALFGYRDRAALMVTVCANVITNLLLNLSLIYVFRGAAAAVLPLEALVVAAEFGIYALFFGPGLRMFLLTLAANCLSYGLGLLVF